MNENEGNTGEGSGLPFPSPFQSPNSTNETRYLTPAFYETRELVYGHDGGLITIEQLIEDYDWDTDLFDSEPAEPRSELSGSGEPIPDSYQALLPFAFVSFAACMSDQWEDSVNMPTRMEAAQCAFNEHVIEAEPRPGGSNGVKSIWMSASDLFGVISRAIDIANMGR